MSCRSNTDAIRKQAVEMLNSRRGLEASQDGYYTELFQWLYAEIERGRTPAGIPAKLLEQWKAIGVARQAKR